MCGCWKAESTTTLLTASAAVQMREGEAPSYFNPIEAAALVELLEGLLKQHQTKAGRPAVVQDDIGVIATYRKQVSNTCLIPPGLACQSPVVAGICSWPL